MKYKDALQSLYLRANVDSLTVAARLPLEDSDNDDSLVSASNPSLSRSLLVFGGGLWRSLVVFGGLWWSLVVFGGLWWSWVVVFGGSWWSTLIRSFVRESSDGEIITKRKSPVEGVSRQNSQEKVRPLLGT